MSDIENLEESMSRMNLKESGEQSPKSKTTNNNDTGEGDTSESSTDEVFLETPSTGQLANLRKNVYTFEAESDMIETELQHYMDEVWSIETKSSTTVSRAASSLTKTLTEFKQCYKPIIIASNKYQLDRRHSKMVSEAMAKFSRLSSDIRVIIDRLNERLDQVGRSRVESSSSAGSSSTAPPRTEDFYYKNLIPKVQLDKFSGDDLTDAMAYYRFKTSFLEVVVRRANLSGAIKLTLLKANVVGSAYKAIAHFATEDNNYDLALKTLDDLYFDKDKIVSGLMRQIREVTPSKNAKNDHSFNNIIEYISTTKGILSDLKTLGVDCISSITANKIYSQIIFENLPFIVQNEIILKVSNNYPNIQQIFDNYPAAINKLKLKYQSKDLKFAAIDNSNAKPSQVNQIKSKTKSNNRIKSKPTSSSSASVSAQSVSVSAKPAALKAEAIKPKKSVSVAGGPYTLNCKLCHGEGHSPSRCQKYPSLQSRQARLEELNYCKKCMSASHKVQNCPYNNMLFGFTCNLCSQNDHITPLCPRTNLHAK